MAVSGTTNFTVSRDDVIKAAMRGLSVLEESASPTADSITNASMSLNLIIKNWQKEGIKLWTISEIAIPLSANKLSYSIGPAITTSDFTSDKPMKVMQSFLRNNQVTPPIDIPMQVISRQEYNMLGSKSSVGLINSVYYQPLATNGIITVFMNPDSTTSANYVLYLTVQRQLMDVNVGSDNFDFPSEWFLALKWALMSEMSSDYDKTIQDRTYYDQKALYFKTEVQDSDFEDVAVRFVPDMRMTSSKGFM